MGIHIALISFLINSVNTRGLASYLKSHGHKTDCYFCPVEFNEQNLSMFMQVLKERAIDLVGVSLVTDDYPSAVMVTNRIREALGIPVIWGGAHANVRPEECLLYADMICRGEGEEALLELAHSMSTHERTDTSIKNIWFKTDQGIIRNELRSLEEDLDKYPFPDFDLDSQYVMDDKGFERVNEGHFNGEYSIMASRGCPYSCCYCYNSYRRKHYKGKGKYLRTRGIESVIQELIQARQKFAGLSKINFWDDSFVTRSIEDFEIFQKLYASKVGLPFFALIEPMAFDYRKIKLLRDCGLNKLQVGIQSGSERVNREVYNRPVSNKKIIEVANLINGLGIAVIYDFIFNNPYEKPDDIIKTIELVMQFPKPFYLQGYNLIFYPGTEITERALADGFIAENNSVDASSTIQGAINSPTAMKTGTVVSNRFYSICYDSREKEYLGLVFSLLCFKHIPKSLIRFFMKSGSRLKTSLLKAIIESYEALSQLKSAIYSK